MKIRKIGNSIGCYIPVESLRASGLKVGEELEIVATPGEIRIKRASSRTVLEVTPTEAAKLAAGVVPRSIVAKAKKLAESDE